MRIGLEYELQMQIVLKPKWMQYFNITEKIQTVYFIMSSNTFNFSRGIKIIKGLHIPNNNNLFLCKVVDSVIDGTYLCLILYHKGTSFFHIDMGNIEINNKLVHYSIKSALREVNNTLENKVIPFLLEHVGKYIQFALQLPKMKGKFVRVNSVLFNDFMCTKHINISYGPSIYTEFKQMQFLLNRWICVMKIINSKQRLHIKVPYNFTDYSKLFAVKRIDMNKLKENSKPIFLGMSKLQGNIWKFENKLV